MSRLTAYQQKEFRRRLTLIIITLVILIILISTVGFNLLVKTSMFIGSIGGNSNQESTGEQAFFGGLEVDSPPEATNSAKIVISGSVTGYDTVEIEINSKRVKTIKNKSSFEEVIGDLQKGQNTLEVIAKLNNSKKSKKRESFQILYKIDKPKLDLKEPANGAKISNSEIKVAGATDAGVTVQVNGAPTVVDVQGNFQTLIRLNEGDNKIHLTAVDAAGNTETKEITVRYEKD